MKSLQNDGEQKDSRRKLHTLEWTQLHKTPYSQKTQESVHNGNTKCTIVAQNSNNNTNIQAWTTSNIQNMQLVETHIHAETEDTLASSEEDIEGQMQTPNKRRKYRQRQRTQKRTEQMHQYRARKQPEQMTLHNQCSKGYLLQDKIWKFLMRLQSMAMMWEIWTTFVLPVEH